MGLFRKKKPKKIDLVEEKPKKHELIIFELLKTDDDEYITKLAEKLMNGHPLIMNFEALDIDKANKVVAFFSGVVYAIEGEIVPLQSKIVLFASKDCYDDGTMETFIKEVKQ
jgi:cell division inhibitor SepF